MDTKHSAGELVWVFEWRDEVQIYVSIDVESNFFYVEIIAGGKFKGASGSKNLNALLLFVGQQLYRLRVERLLNGDGESYLHHCMEDVKL